MLRFNPDTGLMEEVDERPSPSQALNNVGDWLSGLFGADDAPKKSISDFASQNDTSDWKPSTQPTPKVARRMSPLLLNPDEGGIQASPVIREPASPATLPIMKPQSGMDEEMAKKIIASPSTSPELKAAVQKKFDLGEYSDENRKKIESENRPGMKDAIGSIFASWGATLGGHNPTAASEAVMNRARQKQQDALSNFDKGRAGKIQDHNLDRQLTNEERQDKSYADDMERISREKDPSSEESQLADKLARQMYYKGPAISAEKFKTFSPIMQKMYELEQSKSKKALDHQAKANELGAADAKFLTQIQSGEQAVKDMSTALQNGDNTFSLVGDNDFTRNARVAAEMYGRLQSGGAINKDEEARFMSMLPKVTDSAEQQKKKLAQADAYYKQAQANFKGGKYKSAPKQQTKVVGGITYRKVDGGWEEVE